MMPGFTPGQNFDAIESPRAEESLDFVTLSWNARGCVCNEWTVKGTDAKTFIS